MGGLKSAERLHSRAQFLGVYERGMKMHGRYMTLTALPNAQPFARLGITASRRFGGAVTRNRAKRLIREVFRRNKIAPGFDIVVIPKRELLGASLTALEADYRQILARSVHRSRGAQRI